MIPFLNDPDNPLKGIDELFTSVKAYASSEKFKELLKFTAHFKSYAPYNAMLIHIQCPGARYVLSARNWRKYNRVPISDRRPIIILAPFGPVDYVYDIGDTTILPGGEDCFPSELARPYDGDPKQSVDKETFSRLVENLKYWGIAYDTMRAGVDYSGKIEIGNFADPDLVFSEKDNCPQRWRPAYSIRVCENSSMTDKFVAIVHELGHLFLRHIKSAYDKNWVRGIRIISHESEEFEAETVSWLVCRRLGVDSPSYRYLSFYFVKNNSIPEEVSVDEILKATRLVEQVLSGLSLKECWLYSKCSDFKKATDEIRKNRKKLNLFPER